MILLYVLLYILITALIIYYLYSILNDNQYEKFTSTRYIENKVLPNMINNNKSYYIIDRNTNECLTLNNGIIQLQPYNKNNKANQEWQFKKIRLSNNALPANYNGLEVRNNVLRYRTGENLNDSNRTYQYALNYQYRNLSPNDAFIIQQKNKNGYVYVDNKGNLKLASFRNTNYTLSLKGIRYEQRVEWIWVIRYIVQPFRTFFGWLFSIFSRIFYRVFRITIRVPRFYWVAIPYYLYPTMTIDNAHEFTKFSMKNNKLAYVDNNQAKYIQINKDKKLSFNTNINKITSEWYIVDALAIERYYEDNKAIIANKEFKKSVHESVKNA